jgi:hypothetical protein
MNQRCKKCGKWAVYWDSLRKLTRCHHCELEMWQVPR